MKYLLDTHTAIWALGDKQKLSKNAIEIIDNTSVPLYVSITSAWEIVIKVSVNKLKFHGGAEFFLNTMQKNGIELLGVESAYIKQLEKLPLIHKDPFDRLLIATSLSENMTLITKDDNIQKYNVQWIW